MSKKNLNKDNIEWQRMRKRVTEDSVRIRVPRAFLSTLNNLFRHVLDAMGGDDRPDHGLAMVRGGQDHCRIPFRILRGSLARAERKMKDSEIRKAAKLYYQFHELAKKHKII